MKIAFIEQDERKFETLSKYFENEKVELVNKCLKDWASNNDANAFVAPSNSCGLMSQGFNYALTDLFGYDLEAKIFDYIAYEFGGSQPVGSAFTCKIPASDKYLIHTATVDRPRDASSEKIIYECMKNSLINAKANNMGSVIVPMLGAGSGRVNPDASARMMYEAYQEFIDNSLNSDWVNDIRQDEKLKIKKQKFNRK